MKKALLLATTGVALLLAGCSNNSSSSKSTSTDNSNATYKTEMTKGNDAVTDKKYSKAVDHFTSASKAKKTDKAHDSKIQAQNLIKAKKLMNHREFNAAKSALKTVKKQDNGNKKMVSRAKTLLAQIKDIQLNRSNFKADIKNAKQLSKNNANGQAKVLLEQVTNFKGIKGKYYSDLYTQAKSLLDSLPSDTDSSSTTDNNESNSTDNSTTDTNSSDSSATTDSNNNSDSSSSDQSNNPAANGDFDVEKKEVDGKTITDDDIAKARQQLTSDGVKNVDAWSDNDIVRAIKNATKDGRSTVRQSDGKIQ
ncbi:hypothetical protein COSHB9_00510 [Companilactobacillus alimentarius]